MALCTWCGDEDKSTLWDMHKCIEEQQETGDM